ncbi:Uncharacterised protein [Mycobacteroides abscessus subsp. massiliense]|nr:Uncharacterised protein [Mycobacteroides abscessus subsp. massiliense]
MDRETMNETYWLLDSGIKTQCFCPHCRSGGAVPEDDTCTA